MRASVVKTFVGCMLHRVFCFTMKALGCLIEMNENAWR